MTIVERCARRLEPLAWSTKDTPPDYKACENARERSLDIVRTILDELMTPTEEMEAEGKEILRDWDDRDIDTAEEGARFIWQAMIKAAREEGK